MAAEVGRHRFSTTLAPAFPQEPSLPLLTLLGSALHEPIAAPIVRASWSATDAESVPTGQALTRPRLYPSRPRPPQKPVAPSSHQPMRGRIVRLGSADAFPVPARQVLFPSKRVAHNGVEMVVHRPPPQRCPDALGGGDHAGGIACSSRAPPHGKVAPRRPLDRCDRFQHGKSLAIATIEDV